MPKEFGKRVRTIRELKGMTREELCDDETKLSVRQLARIEAGSSAPSIQRGLYIAQMLGVAITELTGDISLELPQRYKELKYLILKTPTYMDEERLKQREEQFDEIYDNYFDNLPEEEQFVMSLIQSRFDVYQTGKIEFGTDLIDDYFEQVCKKRYYQLNDLILIDLFMMCGIVTDFNEEVFNLQVYNQITTYLLNQSKYLPLEDFFFLNNVLLICVDIAMRLEVYHLVPQMLSNSRAIMTKAQDFHKMPIYNFFEWQYALKVLDDKVAAKGYYEQAVLFAQMIGDEHLVGKLEQEWGENVAT